MASGGRRFDALDSIRGIAALAVVVNHCLNMFPEFGGAVQGDPAIGPIEQFVRASPLSLAWNGRGAVAIFFVLSGFVLSLPWFRGTPLSYRLFVFRRFCRIYLPYVVAVAGAMGLATWLGQPHPPQLSAWFVANWKEPVSSAAVVDHFLMLGGHNTFDNAVWSLNHEMRISLVFPLLILPVVRFGLPGAIVAAVALYGTAGAITHFAGWQGAPAEIAATIRFGMFFVLGAALAHSADGLAARQPNWLATTVLLAGLACLWLSTEPAMMAGGSVLILLAAVLPGRIRRTLNHPWLRWLGRISYSLYLTHLLVLLSAAHLLAAMLPMKVILAGVAVTALVFAAGFQRLVEAPSDRLGRRLTRGFALSRAERTAPQIVEPPSLRQRVGAALADDEAMELSAAARKRV